MIIACDHPARGALGAAGKANAMASRTDLLDRLVTALTRPGVDGLLATADIAEDLLLLGVLEEKLVFASMNRGGLQGATFEMDDRNTGYDVQGTIDAGFEGAKMLLRIDLDDPATVATLERCGEAVTELNRAELIAMVEPFMSSSVRRQDRQRPIPGRGDQVCAYRAGSRRFQRVHLDEAARGPRDGAGDGCDDAADPAARRRSRQRAGRDLRRVAGGSGAAVGPWSGGRPHHALPGRRRRRQGGRHGRLAGPVTIVESRYVSAGPAPPRSGPYEVEVTPESAGWGYSSLQIISLARRQAATVSTPALTR